MATFGVKPEGFLGKPLATVEAEIDTDLKGILGASAGTEPDGTIPLRSKAGQIKVFLVDLFSEQWDLQQAVYASYRPASASGAALDEVCSITGTIRENAKFSSVVGTCTGTPLTFLPQGRVASVENTGSRFATLTDATIAAVGAWVALTLYALGDRRSNGGNVYLCITAGTSAGSGGPSGTSSDITDGTVHWKWLGAGDGAVDVTFEAEVAGPIGANAGELNQIATPVSGWSNVVNLLDAEAGALQETDPALRARRDFEVTLSGNATADAILAAISAVNQSSQDPAHRPPSSVRVLYNDEDVPDANGVPAHSVEVIVEDGTAQDIANEIWKSVATGIRTYGNQTSTVIDKQGRPQTLKWTRPTPVDLYIVSTVYYDPSKWPSSGAGPLVEQGSISAILTFADGYPPGFSVRTAPLSAALFDGPSALNSDGTALFPAPVGASPMPGILDATPFYIGTSPSPVSSAPVTINVREIAKFDSTRITITATPEAP